MAEIDDLILTERARRGDRAAIDTWLRRHLPAAAALLAARTNLSRTNPAFDDLVQETALRAVAGLGKLREPAYAGTWICSIALNVWQTHLRTHRRNKAVEMNGEGDNVIETLPDPAAGGVDSDRPAIAQAVDRLPEKLREVVYLKYSADMRYQEIAAHIAVSTDTVKARLHEARRLLRQMLEAER